MTGFGVATRPLTAGTDAAPQSLTVELRSVNLRFLEVKVRQPFGAAGEERIHQRIKARKRELGRGRVDVHVHVQRATSDDDGIGLEDARVRQVLAALARITELGGQQKLEVRGPTTMEILKFSTLSRPGDSDRVAAIPDALEPCLDEALEALCRMRAREGAALAEVILEHARQLESRVADIETSLEGEGERLQDRLQERIHALLARVDAERPAPERIAQEVAILVQKGDVAEELARIASHLAQLREVVGADHRAGQGKTLDFLCQELFREITTIGSKITSHRGSGLMIEAKSCVERLREQVQNVE
ncbi:MAG: DUF1732 domain-containing protein [Myxococcales bacterium]|nr:DUF1732 domain-containing protein [Myxococcales bacterium]